MYDKINDKSSALEQDHHATTRLPLPRAANEEEARLRSIERNLQARHRRQLVNHRYLSSIDLRAAAARLHDLVELWLMRLRGGVDSSVGKAQRRLQQQQCQCRTGTRIQ